MKPGRQGVILEIISEQDIETQHQLMQALAERGIKSTQATLSRDIKDMRLVKQLGPRGNYRYVQSSDQSRDDTQQKLRTIFQQSIQSYDLAQNILVLRTMPGLASAACAAIDGMQIEKLVGSLAGDDTAFLAMKDNETAVELYHTLEKLMEK